CRVAVVCKCPLAHPIDHVPGNAHFRQFGRDAQLAVQLVQPVGKRYPFKTCELLEVANLLDDGFIFQVPTKDSRHQDGVEGAMMKLCLLETAQRMAEGMDGSETLLER